MNRSPSSQKREQGEFWSRQEHVMAVHSAHSPASKLLDKRMLQKAVADLDQRMGFVQDPTATAEGAQAMMLARGIRPEDRILSSEIIRMRHQHEEE